MARYRKPADAVTGYLDPIAEVVACFTREIVLVSGWYPAVEPHALRVGTGAPVALKTSYGLTAQLRQRYEIERDPDTPRDWRIRTSEYAYEFLVPDADAIGRRAFAYHWHPLGTEATAVRYPHVHVGKAVSSTILGKPVTELHFPSGRVSLEEVLTFAVNELHVEPLRDDFAVVLERTRRDFLAKRSWP